VKSEESLRSMSDATLALSARVNVDEILGSSGTSAVLLTLIHRRAWKGNSPKFVCRILHSPSPTPLESPPPGTPHPRGFPGADLRLLRWMGILGSAETEDGDNFIEAVPCCRCQ
jgi:hypothetical protein